MALWVGHARDVVEPGADVHGTGADEYEDVLLLLLLTALLTNEYHVPNVVRSFLEHPVR